MARLVASLVLGTTIILLSFASAALIFILAASIISNSGKSCALVLAAAIVQALSGLAFVALLTWQCRSATPSIRVTTRIQTYLPLLFLGVLPSVAAAGVVGAALGWSVSTFANHSILVLGGPVSTFFTAVFVVWGVTLLAQLLYFLCSIWLSRPMGTSPQQRFAIDDTAQQMQEASRPATGKTEQSAPSNPFRETVLSSRTTVQSDPFQTFPSTPTALAASSGETSHRSSFSTIARPSSAKHSILTRHPSYQRPSQHNSRRSSFDTPPARPSQDSGFDAWDTSSVSSEIHAALQKRDTASKPPLKPTPLAPIPGSRSPSPAKALEGPFFPSSPTPPKSPLPQPPVSQPNSPPSSPTTNSKNAEIPNFTALFPPPSPGSPPTTTRNFSRRNSLARTSEEHIHPLFRTNSPTPPPSASFNTTVTAAPEAGQLINERILRRMRSGSLGGQQAPVLVRSESTPDIRASRPPLASIDGNAMMPLEAIGGRREGKGEGHRRKRSRSIDSLVAQQVLGGCKG